MISSTIGIHVILVQERERTFLRTISVEMKHFPMSCSGEKFQAAKSSPEMGRVSRTGGVNLTTAGAMVRISEGWRVEYSLLGKWLRVLIMDKTTWFTITARPWKGRSWSQTYACHDSQGYGETWSVYNMMRKKRCGRDCGIFPVR